MISFIINCLRCQKTRLNGFAICRFNRNHCQPPEALSAGEKLAGQRCAICQTAIVAGEVVVICPDCALPFHDECWQENRGCAQYGCASAPETVKAEAAPDAVGAVWGDEKTCPACGRKIKAQAVKCRHCGAVFETRDLIDAQAYAAREYMDGEYAKARNVVAVLFLGSASGCLSPVALVMLAVLRFGKSCLGIEYRRLPSVLKMLVNLGFGLSILLLFLFLLFAVVE